MYPTEQTKFAKAKRNLAAKRTKIRNKIKGRKESILRQLLLLKNYIANPLKYGGKSIVSEDTLRNMERRAR